ncbi:MAG: SurA N-terminal domain-containing protein [Candidatus Acetothermia bacterium]
MRSSKKSLVAFVLVSLLIFSFLGVSAQEDQSTVVAEVNGEEISLDRVEQKTQIQQIVGTLGQQIPVFAQFLTEKKGEESLSEYREFAGEEVLREYRLFALNAVIDEVLAEQKAKELEVTVSDDEVQAEIDNIVESNEQFESESDLEEYLEESEQYGGMEELRSQVENDLEMRKLQEEVSGSVEVTEEEIESFYEENQASFSDSEGNVQDLSEVSSQIEEHLANQKRGEAYNEWLENERETADIEIYEEEIPTGAGFLGGMGM